MGTFDSVEAFDNPYEFACTAYVAHAGSAVLVVDPGFYLGAFRARLAQLGRVDAVLLTHGHWDHIGGLEALLGDFPDAPCYIGEGDLAFLGDPQLNGSGIMAEPVRVAAPVAPLAEGDHDLAGVPVRVLHTPGHTRGSVCYHVPAAGAFFTGDTIIGLSVGRTDLPTGSADAQRESLRRLAAIDLPEGTFACCGHDAQLPWKTLLARNPFLALP